MANINKLLRQWQTISTLTRDCLLATTYIDLYDKQITVDNFIKQFFSLLVAADYNGSELETAIKEVVFGGALVAPGITMLWSYTSLPDGYLKMDGSAVSRSTYSDLYAVLGTYYGNGDGSNTFNLPNVSGYFIRFVDDGAGVDPGTFRTAAPGGTVSQSGSTQSDATGAPQTDFTLADDGDHSHSWPDIGSPAGSNNDYVNTTGSITSGTNTYIDLTSTGGGHTHTVESGDDETRPYNIYLTGIIKY